MGAAGAYNFAVGRGLLIQVCLSRSGSLLLAGRYYEYEMTLALSIHARRPRVMSGLYPLASKADFSIRED